MLRKSINFKLLKRVTILNNIKNKSFYTVSCSYQNIPSPKEMKIYTKTGDKGTSSLFTGERRPKDDIVFEALGNTDELNSLLGLAREYCKDENIDLIEEIEKIQCILLDLGSHIATPRQDTLHSKRLEVTTFDTEGELVKSLEDSIDSYDQKLPKLKNFILPSGGKAASTLHLARSVCRRAERSVVGLIKEENVDKNVGIYLNRLSDYLFTVARYACHVKGDKESIYQTVKRGGKGVSQN